MRTQRGPLMIDSLDKPNAPSSAPDMPAYAVQPRSARAAVLGCAIVAIVPALPLAILYAVDPDFRETAGSAARVFVWGAVGLALVAGLVALYRLLIVHLPGGVPVLPHQVARGDAYSLAGRHFDVYEQYASRQLPNVTTYTPTYTQASAPQLQAQPLAALPAPSDTAPNIGPLSVDEWLRWLDSEPHAIFAAKTKGGKSTMAKVGLRGRVERGESIFVIDPHSNGWLDLPSVGGGQNWDEIEAAMGLVLREYQSRMYTREQHRRDTGDELPHDAFPRLTVIFDEALESRFHIEQRHGKKGPWYQFSHILGSGARKVGICVWLITQSALVKDLGLSTVMRRNFTVFALDHATIADLVEDEERNKARREVVIASLAGQTFPAASVINGEAYLLDRVGLDRYDDPHGSFRCAWDAWDYTQRAPVEDAEEPALIVPSAMRYGAMNNGNSIKNDSSVHSIAHSADVDAEELAREWFAAGLSQREVGRRIRERGLTIDQNEFPRLQREGLKSSKE